MPRTSLSTRMQSGPTLVVLAAGVGLLAGIVGTIAIIDTRGASATPTTAALAHDAPSSHSRRELLEAIERLTLAVELQETDALGDGVGSEAIAQLVQRIEQILDRLGELDREAGDEETTLRTRAQIGDEQHTADNPLTRLQARGKSERVFASLSAQQLIDLLADPGSSEADMLRMLKRLHEGTDEGEAYEVLMAAVYHPSAAVRAAALYEMGEFDGDTLLPMQHIANQLKDPDLRVRQATLWLLGGMGTEQAARTILAYSPSRDDLHAYAHMLDRVWLWDDISEETSDWASAASERYDDLDTGPWYDEFNKNGPYPQQ